MIMKFRFFILSIINFTILFSVLPVSANIYSEVEVAEGTPSQAKYQFSIMSWNEIGDEEPNPCYGASACWLKVNHVHGSGLVGGLADAVPHVALQINSYPTTKDVRLALMQSSPLPLKGSIEHRGLNPSPYECVGLFYGPNQNNTISDTLYPNSICGLIPPPVGVCEITPELLTLDHGSVSLEDISGNIASATIQITCSREMEVKLVAADQQIDLGGGVLSNIYLNDSNDSSGVNVQGVPSGTAVNISSHLEKNGTVMAGEHLGSTVLLLAIP